MTYNVFGGTLDLTELIVSINSEKYEVKKSKEGEFI